MRRALLNGTAPDKTGHDLGMAHHYRTPGAKTKTSPRAGGSPLPQAGLGKTQTTGSPPGETIGLPKVNRMAQEKYRETGKEQRDAPCRPCQLHQERRA